MSSCSLVLLVLFIPVTVLADSQWEPVPLRSEAQKEKDIIGGEGLQNVQAIVYAPSNPSIVYLSTDTSQVWKSMDGGVSWRHTSRGFISNGARSLIVDPVNPGTVFAAGFYGHTYKDGTRINNRLQGIYRSTDGAESWSFIKKTDFFKQDSTGCLFAFDSSSATAGHTRIIYCGSFNVGLLRSDDSGLTWSKAGFSGMHIIDMKEDPSSPGSLYIAVEGGLYRYSAGSIRKIGSGLPAWPRSIGISPNEPRTIYAAVGNSGIYKSTNGGESFYSSSQGLFPALFYSDLAVSPLNANIVYARTHLSGWRPFHSHDGGITWHKPLTTNLGNLMEEEGFYFSSPFAQHPREPLTALTVTNGMSRVIRTTDGGKHWAFSSSGFMGGRMEDIAFDNDRMLFCLTDHGCWLTRNRGDTFRQLKTKRMLGLMSSSSGALRGNTIVASIGTWGEKGLVVSQDLGGSWTYFHDLIDRYRFISFHSSDKKIIYAGSYRSIDGGRNWVKLLHPVRAMYPGNGDIVYAFQASSNKGCEVLKSLDQGRTWTSPYAPCPYSKDSIHDIRISPVDPDRLYLACSSGVLIHAGGTWKLRNEKNGIAKDAGGMCYVRCIAIDPNNAELLYAGRRAPGFGQSNGIFRSMDGGMTWNSISDNLGQEISVWAIRIDPKDSTVYIGTSQGTWKRSPARNETMGSAGISQDHIRHNCSFCLR